jgi:hypothetical protein
MYVHIYAYASKSRRARVADVALLLVVPKKDVVSNRLWI